MKLISAGQQAADFKKRKTRFSACLSFGGDMRDRTADLLNAIQALSQLSYTPKLSAAADDLISIAHLDELVNSIL